MRIFILVGCFVMGSIAFVCFMLSMLSPAYGQTVEMPAQGLVYWNCTVEEVQGAVVEIPSLKGLCQMGEADACYLAGALENFVYYCDELKKHGTVD